MLSWPFTLLCCYTQVRNTATHTLQRVAINGERIGVVPASLERGLRERVLPPIETLSKKVKSRDMPQVRKRSV